MAGVSKINTSSKYKKNLNKDVAQAFQPLHFSQVNLTPFSPEEGPKKSISAASSCLVAPGGGAALISLFLKMWALLILKPVAEVLQQHLIFLKT